MLFRVKQRTRVEWDRRTFEPISGRSIETNCSCCSFVRSFIIFCTLREILSQTFFSLSLSNTKLFIHSRYFCIQDRISKPINHKCERARVYMTRERRSRLNKDKKKKKKKNKFNKMFSMKLNGHSRAPLFNRSPELNWT